MRIPRPIPVGDGGRSLSSYPFSMYVAARWALVLLVAGIVVHSRALADDRVLLDTDADGWELWTAYGPGMNETYGSGNNSKHYHHPSRVLTSGSARILEAVDTGAGQPKRYQSGCLSTREAPNGAGFFRFADDIRSLRFEFDVTVSDWNHAVWPACWLRGVGGAVVHEIDVLEGFTAQTGTNIYRFAVHSAGNVNVIRDPWPGTPLMPGERATVWVEIHRPGTLHATDAYIRAGIDSTTTVSAPDPYSAQWWADEYGWDLIVQQQIGGNWVGDPDVPYTGFLQNGQPGRPAEEVPTWQLATDGGYSTLTIHRVRVIAALDILRIEETLLDSGTAEIRFDSWMARSYTLETSTNLLHGEWSPVAEQGPRPGAGGPDIMSAPFDPPRRYFRLLYHSQ